MMACLSGDDIVTDRLTLYKQSTSFIAGIGSTQFYRGRGTGQGREVEAEARQGRGRELEAEARQNEIDVVCVVLISCTMHM